MSDPRHAHEFVPNKYGKCKALVGFEICHEPEDFAAHKRFRSNKCVSALGAHGNRMMDEIPKQAFEYAKRAAQFFRQRPKELSALEWLIVQAYTQGWEDGENERTKAD